MRLDQTRTIGRLVRWRIPGVPPDQSFLGLLAEDPFTLLDEGPHHAISGLCGRIWTLSRDYGELAGPDDFLAWNEPRTVRVLFAHWVTPDAGRRGAARSTARPASPRPTASRRCACARCGSRSARSSASSAPRRWRSRRRRPSASAAPPPLRGSARVPAAAPPPPPPPRPLAALFAGGARPRCYLASPLGFSEAGRAYYAERYVPALAEHVEPVDPWTLSLPAEFAAARAAGREHAFGSRSASATRPRSAARSC